MTNYTWDTNISVQTTIKSISFDNDLKDFKYDAATADSVGVDLTAKTANFGNMTSSCSVLWYGGNSDVANCASGKCDFGKGVRIYFEFLTPLYCRNSTTITCRDTDPQSKAHGNGFTFALISGENNDIFRRGGTPGTFVDDKNKTKYPMGDMLCYAGSGNTSDKLGLRSPKMAIEFDTFRNPNSPTYEGCGDGERNDAYDSNNKTANLNHVALVLWGNSSSGYCSSSSFIGQYFGNTVPKISYDDNVHKIPSSGTTSNPQNSYYIANAADSDRGYCQRYDGKVGSYNWMEDDQTHRVRVEINRATTAAESSALGCTTSGTYAYQIKAWVDCETACCTTSSTCSACPTTSDAYKDFQDVSKAFSYSTYAPKINRTICIAGNGTNGLHEQLSTIIFGFTGAGGHENDSEGKSQNVQLQKFEITFIH